MADTLTFTTPIVATNMTKLKLGRIVNIDEDNNIMSFEAQLQGPGGILFPQVFPLTVTNGTGCDALVANPSPTSLADIVLKVSLSAASTPTAFTTALAAYRTSGADRRGALITALLGVTGVVSAAGAPALIGTTIPILPAGTVS